MSAPGQCWPTTRFAAALLVANIRYWTHVAPLTRAQLSKWRREASAITDPLARTIALQKLRDENFNSEVATTLATIAPRKYRPHVVAAIVAYEVMYDYLDGLTEQPSPDPLRHGKAAYRAFTQAVNLDGSTEAPILSPHVDDGGYLLQLAFTVRRSLQALPSTSAVLASCTRAAHRCAEAQARAHAVPVVGRSQVEAWARTAAENQLGWRAYLAGAASSVLAVHALIAAAADPRTTAADAARLDATYLLICATSTLLDGLVDAEDDLGSGASGYLQYYDDTSTITDEVVTVTTDALRRAAPMRQGSFHVVELVGVVAYYCSAPTAENQLVVAILSRLRHDLGAPLRMTLTVMRAWRLARRVRSVGPHRHS